MSAPPSSSSSKDAGGAPLKTAAEIKAAAATQDSGELAKKRGDYYDKWSKMSKEELSAVTAEEEALKIESQKKLGLDNPDLAVSEEHRLDMEKHKALKEAKKVWDEKKDLELKQKFLVTGETDVKRVLTRKDVDHRPVLAITKATRCEYELSVDLGSLIKLFVEECSETKIIVRCGFIVQHIEISHCADFTLTVGFSCQTVQVDLSENITVIYEKDRLIEGNRVYHAAVKNLTVKDMGRASDPVVHDYTLDESKETAIAGGQGPAEEKQFVTHLKDGVLKTERVRRALGMMPLTDAELTAIAATTDIEQAAIRQASEKKNEGNEAFEKKEYLQAAVFYTQAISLAPTEKTLLRVCLANRAASNLKLGRLEEGLDDAIAAVEVDPTYAKAWFRKGIALHALKKYGPAIEALSKADDLAPKDKAINEAIGFAKVMLNKQARELEEKRKFGTG